MPTERPRIVHVVTGGFSGATQVAVDLCRAHAASGRFDARLVLRRKRQTEAARVQALRDEGLQVDLVPGWSHAATIASLWRLYRQWQPQLVVAHGFPEHLLARWAALWAGVPAMVQVEHNSRERYTPWRRWQSRRLAAHTAALVGVSEGVRESLLAMGLPTERTLAIPNGIVLTPFDALDVPRPPPRAMDLTMSARFARQKDHETLIRALAWLRDQRGLRPRLQLAGAGKSSYRDAAQRLVASLGLQEQVEFLGHVADVPAMLMRSKLFVLSTRWEGMPLALVEAMAAGCACVASDVPGVRGVFEPGAEGLLVPPEDPAALGAAIERLLQAPALAAQLGSAARRRACAEYGQAVMRARYEDLFDGLCRGRVAGGLA
jgi:glycosyltransferase involved in cell wall biosynthesis